MRPLTTLLVGIVLSCAMFAGAYAFTTDEQAQLDDILTRASDVSDGSEVGGAMIIAKGGVLIAGEDACTFSRLLNADEFCDTSAILIPPESAGIDSICYAPPEDIGYVNMDDWTDEATSEIDQIWNEYVEGTKAQSSA